MNRDKDGKWDSYSFHNVVVRALADSLQHKNSNNINNNNNHTVIYKHCIHILPACITIAAKINHDVSFSVHKAGECQWSDITPYFEGPEESIIYDFLIQIHSVSEDSVESTESVSFCIKTIK